MAPTYYKLNRKLTEPKSSAFKFYKTKNQNCFEQYIKHKEYVPGPGKYDKLEPGLKL